MLFPVFHIMQDSGTRKDIIAYEALAVDVKSDDLFLVYSKEYTVQLIISTHHVAELGSAVLTSFSSTI